MKRILVMLSILFFAGAAVYAQETMTEGVNGWADEWKTEHTLRLRGGFFTEGVMFTSGIRVDEKRTLGLFAGLEGIWASARPLHFTATFMPGQVIYTK